MSTPDDSASTISVVLLPSDSDSQILRRLSAQINEQTSSLIRLDEDHLPHITIAQFRAPELAAEDLWRSIAHFRTAVAELTAGGLALVPERGREQIWVEVQFLKPDSLVRLLTAVIRTKFAVTLDLSSAGEDTYRPHCTLALLDGLAIPGLILDDWQQLRRPYESLTLAVGLNGEFFTLKKVLFR